MGLGEISNKLNESFRNNIQRLEQCFMILFIYDNTLRILRGDLKDLL